MNTQFTADYHTEIMAAVAYVLCVGYLLLTGCPLVFALPLGLVMAGVAAVLLTGVLTLLTLPLTLLTKLMRL